MGAMGLDREMATALAAIAAFPELALAAGHRVHTSTYSWNSGAHSKDFLNPHRARISCMRPSGVGTSTLYPSASTPLMRREKAPSPLFLDSMKLIVHFLSVIQR